MRPRIATVRADHTEGPALIRSRAEAPRVPYMRNLALTVLGIWAFVGGMTQLGVFSAPPRAIGILGTVAGVLLILSVFGGKEPAP